MKTNNYTPKPLDTAGVELPAELLQLADTMARNVHEVWARTRIEQGWTYGPARNDQLKQHPCLVPYDELPESEKEYDRCTALETLKTLSALGWKLVKTEK
jgi:ryanodine receptor 2